MILFHLISLQFIRFVAFSVGTMFLLPTVSFVTVEKLSRYHIHTSDFMLRTGFGLDFLGKQGGEQLHSIVSHLARRSAATRNDKNRMKNILENALLLTAPEQHACTADKTQTTTKIVHNIPHKTNV